MMVEVTRSDADVATFSLLRHTNVATALCVMEIIKKACQQKGWKTCNIGWQGRPRQQNPENAK